MNNSIPIQESINKLDYLYKKGLLKEAYSEAQFLSKEQPSYDIEDTKRASDFTVFNRAWHYIRQIDIDDEKHLQAIIEFKKDPFLSALVSALEYFQDPDIEQYERCAFLLKIIRLKKQV